MTRKHWFLLGAGFGFVVPILLNVIQRFGPWNIRPTTYALFRPGSIVLRPAAELLPRAEPFIGFVILFVNAIVFGTLAYGLRYVFLLFIGILLVVNFLSLPPSDASLKRNLSVQHRNLEQLIEKANQTPSLVRIEKDEIEDSAGRRYRAGDPKSPLSPESWHEYRELFQKAGIKKGLHRSPQTGQIQFLTATLVGKIGPIGTLYGYVYCPTQSDTVRSGLLPCSMKEKDEYDIGDYRYKRLSPEWSIVEIFQTHSLVN
jgi:hypothetical protein